MCVRYSNEEEGERQTTLPRDRSCPTSNENPHYILCCNISFPHCLNMNEMGEKNSLYETI